MANQRNVSQNTIESYRDTFILLLRYAKDQKKLSPEKVTLERLDVQFIQDFLRFLEIKRNCVPRTRNHRLAVFHAFFRYIQTEEPECMVQSQQILAIPYMKCVQSPVNYLTIEDMAILLAQPDITILKGRRDAILLSVLYDTGARVQELIDLLVGDVRLQSPSQIRLTGKGRKIRVVPLLSGTSNLLAQYIKEHELECPEHLKSPLFFNKNGERLSRSGIRYILAKYYTQAQKKSSLFKNISPHVLRHTKAMHLLQAGNPTPIIQSILGHADLKTTDIYAHADLEMKKKALEKAEKSNLSITLPKWKNNKKLMDWLHSL